MEEMKSMLKTLGSGCLVFSGIMCFILAILEFPSALAILAIIMGALFCTPALKWGMTVSEKKAKASGKVYEPGSDKLKRIFNSSEGAMTIIRHCKSLFELESVRITSTDVTVVGKSRVQNNAESQVFEIDLYSLCPNKGFNRLKIFSEWVFSQVDNGTFVLKEIGSGGYTGSFSVTPVTGGYGGYSVSRDCDFCVYGYEIVKKRPASNGPKPVKIQF